MCWPVRRGGAVEASCDAFLRSTAIVRPEEAVRVLRGGGSAIVAELEASEVEEEDFGIVIAEG
jgi:hypothetical protein